MSDKWAMLAEKVKEPFDDPKFLFEWKFNGMRIKVVHDGGPVQLIGRSGANYTAQFPELANMAQRIKAQQAEIDGEIVCLNPETGLPDFNRLQYRYNQRNGIAIKTLTEKYPATLMAFDVINLNGIDLTYRSANRANQMQRKTILAEILLPDGAVKLSPWIDGKGKELYQQAKKLRQEGIMAKTKTGLYYPNGRLKDWLKVKVPRRGYFLIGGYTQGTGWRQDLFGAVILGLPTPQGLKYVGNAGTGFEMAQITEVFNQLKGIRVENMPFVPGSKIEKVASWVLPYLVAEIEYGDVTKDGMLVWPSFQGLRPDLTAADTVLEVK